MFPKQPNSFKVGSRDQARTRASRLERLVRDHFEFVWRMAHRLGLQLADAEDVAQRVMLIASDRMNDLVDGKERAFLLRTTLFATDRVHRAQRRRPEEPAEDLSEWSAQGAEPDEIVEQRRNLTLLDRVLSQLPMDLRTVLVLFEIEGFSQSEIGATLGIPQGTVASRIRRAKAQFLHIAARQRLLPKGIL